MSIINNGLLLASGADAAVGYQISRSIRLNAPDSAYFSRTPSSAGNRKTWTWAGWVKRSRTSVSNTEVLFQGGPGAGGSDSNYYLIRFDGSDRLDASSWNGAAKKLTTQVFRDLSAWYHIVFTFDSTQATTANRQRFYVNGVEVTTFTTDSAPTQNTDYGINAAVVHNIGREEYAGGTANAHFSGYLADIHFIDGQALAPSDFAETNATTGQWVPKAYTGSYGTNGFHLTFSDNSGTTSTTLGNDVAGSNDFTPNNFSVASGSGNDSLVDTPTSYGTDTGAGGEVRGNYATLNPLSAGPNAVLANGNLDWSTTQTGSFLAQSTIAMPSGKWYCEYTATSGNNMVGVQRAAGTVATSYVGGNADSWGYYGGNGNKYNNNSSSAYGASYTTGDVIGITLDVDAGTLTFYKNGVSQGQAYSGLTNGPYTFVTGNGANVSGTFNFGARAFSYQAPSGFKALCDTNLTAPTIALPNTVMDVKLWTGNGGTQTISGLGFSPDFVWIKSRSAAYNHRLLDTIRGATKELYSSTTDAETTQSQSLTVFNSDGFSLGTLAQVNESSTTFAGWCWDAGTSTVTNTQGSITSSVRANASAGFSIVTYTGNLSGAGVSTVGHGLGVAPSMVITKRRDGASNWCVQHISTSTAYQILFLDTTDAEYNTSSNGTLSRPTSTVFSINNSTGLGVNGQTHVAYAFAPVAGYSSMGSYVGDGSTSGFGPFVHCGFRPKFVLIKGSSVAYSWLMFDSVRNPYNLTTQVLYANSSTAEMTNNGTGSGGYESIDILSNGFQIKSNSSRYNQSGATYIYFAVAESPFQYARAR